MSNVRVSRGARGSILSSLSAMGAAQPAVKSGTTARHAIVGTLAAAGASLAAMSSAEAGIVEYTPNANIGVAGGDVNNFVLDIQSLKSKSMKLTVTGGFIVVGLHFHNATPASFRVQSRANPLLVHTGAGKKFSTFGVAAGPPVGVGTGSNIVGGHTPSFTDQYYSFSFEDASSDKHYGWMYGSLTGGFSNLSYNLISYAYDTTPGEMIETGQTMSGSVPEPSTLALGAMAALVLGAAGVRRWKKDQEARTTVV